MYIPIIFGTDWINSPQLKGISKYVLDKVNRTGLKTEIIDAQEVNLTNKEKADEVTKKLIESINLADGMIVISPKNIKSKTEDISMMQACFIISLPKNA